jgi:RND family efflux transporter MFP subunit
MRSVIDRDGTATAGPATVGTSVAQRSEDCVKTCLRGANGRISDSFQIRPIHCLRVVGQFGASRMPSSRTRAGERPATSASSWLAAALASLAAGAAAQQPIGVRVVAPEQRSLALSSTQPGTAEAFYEADLGAKVSGFVSELFVDVGSVVRPGQVLARLDVPELVAQRNAARAQVTALRSEHARTEMLAARNSVTQKALAEAVSRLDAAIAAEAALDAQIAYATIEAPFAGVVTARAIDPGDMVFEASSPKGSGEPLLKVAKLDVVRVKTYVPEREAVWAGIGDSATISFDALPGQVFDGTVARLSGALDPATRTMLVEIDLPNPDGRIRPGLYGQVRLTLERRDAALALPAAAVQFDDRGAFVFVAAGGDVARRTPVQTGLNVGGWIEILGGLRAGERVVTAAPPGLVDGAALRVAAQ